MGMTNNQLKLIEAVAKNDSRKIRDYAIACCTEDTTKNNTFEVQRCLDLLNSTPKMLELPIALQGSVIAEDLSNYREAQYYLSIREEALLRRIRKMNQAAIELQQRNVRFLNATMLYGESGVGKTEFARYLAFKMDLPFLYLNFSNIVDSYMGGTSKNISKIFDYAKQNKCVLVLDEMDAIASKREGRSSTSKEDSRIVISLIQHLDSLTNEHIILGATNRPDDIDPAVKRRFTTHHEIEPLHNEEKAAMIEKLLNDAQFSFDRENIMEYVSQENCGKTPAEILSHVTMCMADALIEEKEIRL